jgi:hypothetical protein
LYWQSFLLHARIQRKKPKEKKSPLLLPEQLFHSLITTLYLRIIPKQIKMSILLTAVLALVGVSAA